MPDKLKDWSSTAASNNSTPPNGWPENMAPSAVNNTARQNMASIREWYEDAEWVDLGHAATGYTSTTVVITGDVTAKYTEGRKIRLDQDNDKIATVVSSSYSDPSTTVTVAGYTVGATPSIVELHIISQFENVPKGATDLTQESLPYDLDTLTTPGEYFITLYQSIGGSASFTNGPTPPVSISNSAVGGALIYVSKSGNNVRQAFTWISASDSTLPGTTNTRVSGDGGSSWTNWYTEAQKWGELTGKTDRAGADGYETLPNGFIIQRGLDTSGTVGLTFPLTFPNAILSVSTTAFVPGSTYVHVDSDFSVTTSGLTIFASAGTPSYYWIAVGY